MRPKKANFRLSDGVHKPDRNFAFSGRIRPRRRHFRLVKATPLVQTVGSDNPQIPRDTHRRFDTLHKWCQEWPILSGITLTLIGLVGRCVPVPIYYFGLAKISIE